MLVDDLHLTPAEDLVGVRDAAGDPAVEEMASVCESGCVHHGAVLASARAGEEHQAAAFTDGSDDLTGAAEVGGGHVEGDDVDALADAEDVALVGGVPEGG
jgi:hypothetical protein